MIPTVYEIMVSAEFVTVILHRGELFNRDTAQVLTGRQDARAGNLSVRTTLQDGTYLRSPIDGDVTTSARDALLWASELASSPGMVRRALELPKALVMEALSAKSSTLDKSE